MHFYESSIITTKDMLHCQVYANEHPDAGILIKPKYIPTDKVECSGLQCRFIAGQKMNRLNLWAEKKGLADYIKKFRLAYPEYVYRSELHDSKEFFFWVPHEKIERVFFPRKGLDELMSMPKNSLDNHLKVVYNFADFLLESGLRLKDLGVTYSTLMGNYAENMSDINIVVYGKQNFWKLMKYMETAKHASLRWKNEEEWLDFYKKRNRSNIFEKNTFLKHMIGRKKSEGFFGNSLFVIFAAEKEDEVWCKWGGEKYSSLGPATVEGTVSNHYSSVVRPGCYEITDSRLIDSKLDCDVKKVVFYSRDYTLLAFEGEKIRACGMLEKVKQRIVPPYHRIVTGYFDSYITDRREKEFIKVV